MSRAFTKEPDGDAADESLPERPVSPHPAYVTPGGLRALQDEWQALRVQQAALASATEDMRHRSLRQQVERDLRHVDQLLQHAIVIESHLQAHDDVRFGACVEVVDADGAHHEFTIVGEPEVCAAKGHISWISPLARALLTRRVGDTVLWERPAGNVELEIAAISYPALL